MQALQKSHRDHQGGEILLQGMCFQGKAEGALGEGPSGLQGEGKDSLQGKAAQGLILMVRYFLYLL